MANESCHALDPGKGFAETLGLPSGTLKNHFSEVAPLGLGGGCNMPPGVISSTLFVFRVPNAVALATGLTIEFIVADDPLNCPGGGGLHAVFDFIIAPITSGTTLFDESGLASSTLDSVTLTMASTPGAMTKGTITAVVAHMNSLAAGNWAIGRFRRNGSNASDTDTNALRLVGVDIRNT